MAGGGGRRPPPNARMCFVHKLALNSDKGKRPGATEAGAVWGLGWAGKIPSLGSLGLAIGQAPGAALA